MRNWKTTKFKRTIAISEEDYSFIDDTKGKKSKAGRLAELIAYYKKNNTI